MESTVYIAVILPLKLEWDPCYQLPDGMEVRVGSRVRVEFAHKEYIGVVGGMDVTPQTSAERIRPILCVETGLPDISPDEIRFWRAVAEYYLCSVGEVYKAACPALKLDREEAGVRMRERLESQLEKLREKAGKARKDETREKYLKAAEAVQARLDGKTVETMVSEAEITLSSAQEKAAEGIRKAFEAGKTALLHGVTGSGKTEVYLRFAQETLRKGRSVLYLVPEIALSRQLEERIAAVFPDILVFHSGETAARRTDVSDRVRQGGPYLVLGTRSALFLPHRDLGLVIVDEEHDTSYKQDAPAPRYNGRETAIMLAPYYAGIDAYDPRKDFLRVSKDCVLGHEDAGAMPQIWTLWMYGAGGMDLFPECTSTGGIEEAACSGTGVAWWLLKHLNEFPVLNYGGEATESVKADVPKGEVVKLSLAFSNRNCPSVELAPVLRAVRTCT